MEWRLCFSNVKKLNLVFIFERRVKSSKRISSWVIIMIFRRLDTEIGRWNSCFIVKCERSKGYYIMDDKACVNEYG